MEASYDERMRSAAASLRKELDERRQPSINIAEGLYTVRLPRAAAFLTADEVRTWLHQYGDRIGVSYDRLRILSGEEVVDPADLVDREEWSDEAKVARLNLLARLQAKSNELKGTPGNRAHRRAAARRRR